MSLPKFDVQGSLFESLGSMAANLFRDQDKYKFFATQIWPLLANGRPELEARYVLDNGRPGVEPVVLLGVLILQFLERVPDRQAAELLKYHLGRKLALQALHPKLSVEQRPACWDAVWERYVENKLDYQSNDETLQTKRRRAGLDGWRVLQFVDSLEPELGGGKPVALLRAVWAQQFVMEADGRIEPVTVHATGVISEPTRPGRAVVGQRPGQTEKGMGRLQGAGGRNRSQSGRPNGVYYLGGHESRRPRAMIRACRPLWPSKPKGDSNGRPNSTSTAPTSWGTHAKTVR